MKIAIMQPYFMPYIGYFQLINTVDKFIIYDDVNFIKKGWINRNNILANKNRTLFTIPLKKASQNELIKDISINIDSFSIWKNKFLKTLDMNYSHAKNYDSVLLLLEDVFSYDTDSISDLATYSLIVVCKYLNIKTEIILSSTIYCNEVLSGQERILDICLKEGAKTYINPIGGMELYSESLFLENNIDLFFIKTNNVIYKQFSEEFIPFLSIIDVLVFNDKEQVLDMLNKFDLV